jgi:predicted ester cyclase
MWREAFPDLRVQLEDAVAEGDKVVARFTTTGTHRGAFMGLPPTGRSRSGMMEQLGLMPGPEGAPSG